MKLLQQKPILTWLAVFLLSNLVGFAVALITDPAGFDSSDSAVPERNQLTTIGLWGGALIAIVLPAAAFLVAWGHSGKRILLSILAVVLMAPSILMWILLLGVLSSS